MMKSAAKDKREYISGAELFRFERRGVVRVCA